MTKMSERLRFHGRFGYENGLEQATRKYGEREKAACLLDDAERALANTREFVRQFHDEGADACLLEIDATLARIRGERP